MAPLADQAYAAHYINLREYKIKAFRSPVNIKKAFGVSEMAYEGYEGYEGYEESPTPKRGSEHENVCCMALGGLCRFLFRLLLLPAKQPDQPIGPTRL